MRGFFDARDVLDAARGRWASLLAEFGVRSELLTGRHGPCPGCGGRDRFRFDDKDGEGTFICSQGGGGNLAGNGIALLQHVTRWEWKVCIEEVGRKLLPDSMRRGFHDDYASGQAPVRDDLPDAPRSEREEIPPYDEQKLRTYVEAVPPLTREHLKRVSPVKVETATAADFLEVLYGDRERVLIFTEFYSQGDFLYQVGSGGCRLSQERGVKAVVSPLPTRSREGVWFLCNPVSGKWQPIESQRKRERLPADVCGPPAVREIPAKWGRRSWQSVTSYRYAVLESDCAPEDLWLRALVKMPCPIVAIYSSGGKSLHALVRIDAASKLQWDLWVRGRNQGTHGRVASLMSLVCPLGADPNALTAVRLTRLPFCHREGTKAPGKGYQRYNEPRMQELVYLNPMPLDKKPEWKSLYSKHGGGRR